MMMMMISIVTQVGEQAPVGVCTLLHVHNTMDASMICVGSSSGCVADFPSSDDGMRLRWRVVVGVLDLEKARPRRTRLCDGFNASSEQSCTEVLAKGTTKLVVLLVIIDV
jgi:hypothetical protein